MLRLEERLTNSHGVAIIPFLHSENLVPVVVAVVHGSDKAIRHIPPMPVPVVHRVVVPVVCTVLLTQAVMVMMLILIKPQEAAAVAAGMAIHLKCAATEVKAGPELLLYVGDIKGVIV